MTITARIGKGGHLSTPKYRIHIATRELDSRKREIARTVCGLYPDEYAESHEGSAPGVPCWLREGQGVTRRPRC